MGMNICIHNIKSAVDILICMSKEDIRATTNEDTELQVLNSYIIRGWPHAKDEVDPSVERYWPIMHELAMIDCVVMKSK